MNVRQSQPESDSSSCICCYVRMCVCLIELFFRILFGVSGRFVSGISLLLLLLLLYLLCTIFIFHSDFHIFLVFRIFFFSACSVIVVVSLSAIRSLARCLNVDYFCGS